MTTDVTVPQTDAIWTETSTGREFKITEISTLPNNEQWVAFQATLTKNNYTVVHEQFLRDFKPKLAS